MDFNHISFEIEFTEECIDEMSEIYFKIGKTDKLKRFYHRMLVKNFVVLYTVDYEKRKIFISRMIYGRRNFF